MAAAIGAFFMFTVMNTFAKLLSANHSVIEIAFYRNLIACLPFLVVIFAFGLEDFRRQFADLADLMGQHQGPIILAGDLNTWSDSRQAVVDELMSWHGLEPVSFEPDLRTRVFGRVLDHIYIRGLRALSAEVIPVGTSDHNPLRVRLGMTR